MAFRTLQQMNVKGRMVFVRLDCNVPLDEFGKITEDARIRAALPTLKHLIAEGSRIVVASHLGRPDGQVVEEMRMRPVAARLKELLGSTVYYKEHTIGASIDEAKKDLGDGEVLVIENLRFQPEEEANDAAFAQALAKDIEVYVDDAFGAIHRKHASVDALAKLIPERCAGLLLQKEITALQTIAERPPKPFVIVVGGIKLSDKVAVIERLAPKAEAVLVGGGVGNAFLQALGVDIGASRIEESARLRDGSAQSPVDIALQISRQFHTETTTLATNDAGFPLSKIVTPLDYVVAQSLDATPEETQVIHVGDPIPEGWMILDNGPKTAELYASIIAKAGSVFWNGPFGVFEKPTFAGCTNAIAIAIGACKGYSVLGGGDTESAVQKLHILDQFSHISTGGGASLAYLAGETLPGLAALE